jgi:hypothetical protein
MTRPRVIALALLFALSGTAVAAPPDPAALKTTATTFIDRLAAGDYAKALEACDGPTADKLRDDWQKTVKDVGALRDRAAGDVLFRGTGIIVPVRCTFAEKALDAVLFCTPAGKVSRVVYVPPPLGGPGLIRATMAEVFQAATPGAEGTVTFPVPGPYRDQVPVAFRVEVDPPEALKAAKWVPRDDGLNWLCEVRVAPQDTVLVRWEALVLVGDRPAVALPPAVEPEVPAEAAKWARPGGCVQSNDPAVRAKAEELARGAADIGEYARRVIRFTTLNPYRADIPGNLDARSALRCGSSCTGRANLAAALMRARGIPARTIAHLPTWSGPVFCHWMIEYWHPGVGWVWLEPTNDQPQPPAWTAVVVNVAAPADEDDAFRWCLPSGVAPGVPRRAARELTGGLRPLIDMAEQQRRGAVNQATPVLRLRGTGAEVRDLLAAARRAFPAWAGPDRAVATDTNRADRLLAAARTGGVGRLADELGQP